MHVRLSASPLTVGSAGRCPADVECIWGQGRDPRRRDILRGALLSLSPAGGAYGAAASGAGLMGKHSRALMSS